MAELQVSSSKPLLQSVNRTSGSNLTLDALVDGGGNFVWIGDPFEGFGMGVVIVEEAIDRGLEVGDGSEDSAFEAAFGEGCEETFNGVEPGGRGRREVEGPSRIARQPLAHDGML